MDVRPGYKQTELGVLPADWEIRSLAEHFRIYAGGDVPKHSLSQTQSDSHPHPIFANALQDRGLYGYTSATRSTADSLTITARGYLGHAEYRAEPFFPIVRLLVLEPTGQLDARFTAYVVNGRVEFAVESTGVPQLTAPQVGKYLVAAPPTIEEQRSIAATLSDVDALLSGLDRVIAKKRDLKQAGMHQLLTGQTRLPGFHGEWGMKTLGQIGRSFAGGTPSTSRPDYWKGGIYWLPSGRIQNSILSSPIESEITISQRGLNESAAKTIKADSVLVAITGATCANVALLQFEAAANQSVVAIEPDGDTDHRFLFYALLMERGQILSRQSGSAQGGVNLKAVKGIEVRCPHVDEQTAIGGVLSDMDDELAVLEARRDKTRDLKQAMMQELLTGKTRLVSERAAHA